LNLPFSVSKKLFDVAWGLTFVDAGRLFPASPMVDHSMKDSGVKVRDAISAHSDTITTFEQLLRDEIYGCVDSLLSSFEDALQNFALKAGQQVPVAIPNEFRNVVANTMILKPDTRIILPTPFLMQHFMHSFGGTRVKISVVMICMIARI
jgi:hypothetical protein